jgi:hypothetical protein
LKTACPFLLKPQVHEHPGDRVHLASGSRAQSAAIPGVGLKA